VHSLIFCLNVLLPEWFLASPPRAQITSKEPGVKQDASGVILSSNGFFLEQVRSIVDSRVLMLLSSVKALISIMVWVVVFLLLGGLRLVLFIDFVRLVLVVSFGHSSTVVGILVPSEVSHFIRNISHRATHITLVRGFEGRAALRLMTGVTRIRCL
jgi:hypothetical protein